MPTSALRRIADWELVATLLLVPFLLLPTFNVYATAAAAVGLVLLWLIRWLSRGRVTQRTPLDACILVIMLMLPIALWASPLPAASAEAACRILAGVALYYAWVNGIRSQRAFRWTLRLAVAAGVGVALIGLVASDWTQTKIPLLEPIYRYLPNLSYLLGPLASEQDSSPGAFHPNFIGATLAILLPVAGASLITAPRRFERIAAGLAAGLILVVLLVTQSRLSMVSLAVAASVTLLRRYQRLRRPVWLAVALIAVLVAVRGPQRALDELTPSFAAAGFGSWDSRVALWTVALQVLADFPFTGIGLSAFYPAATYLYTVDVPPTWVFGHAHDIYLQMGVDFGLAGMLAFVAMLMIGLRIGWPSHAAQAGPIPLWRVGVWAGLLTYALFGLFDGLPMWTKPGFLIWVLLGWVVVGRRLAEQPPL